MGITKAKAKEILQVNYTTLSNAAEKLVDGYLLQSLASNNLPITETTHKYLIRLGYDVSGLNNECKECGIKYFYTPMCTEDKCRYCTHKHLFKDRMIIEPNTKEELINNLQVLSEIFDHEISSVSYASEIETVKLW